MRTGDYSDASSSPGTPSQEASPRSRRRQGITHKPPLREVLPRFSISFDEDSPLASSLESQGSLGSSGFLGAGDSKSSERQSRPVVKSASSSMLSLIIPSGEYNVKSYLMDFIKFLCHWQQVHAKCNNLMKYNLQRGNFLSVFVILLR